MRNQSKGSRNFFPKGSIFFRFSILNSLFKCEILSLFGNLFSVFIIFQAFLSLIQFSSYTFLSMLFIENDIDKSMTI